MSDTDESPLWWGFLSDSHKARVASTSDAMWAFQCEPTRRLNSQLIDFFVSYRRDGGATVARLLYEVLKLRGLVGFIDTESLTQGDFSESIVLHITKARNFILVVSPGALESQWVIREIEAALQAGKHIIPIFAGGVAGFPPALPESVACIARLNAITLDHNSFEAKYQQLLTWLVTPHVKLMDACFRRWQALESGGLDVFNAWKSISGDANVLAVCADELRKAWQGDGTSKATFGVLQAIGTWDLKAIAKDLGIEHKGNRLAVVHAIHDWLQGSPGELIAEDAVCLGQDNERYRRLAKELAELYRSGERLGFLKEVVSANGMTPANWRGSQVLMNAVFDAPSNASIDDIFSMLSVTAEDLKAVGANCLGLQGGSSAGVRDRLVGWVDYT
jgi:hypothetical protein